MKKFNAKITLVLILTALSGQAFAMKKVTKQRRVAKSNLIQIAKKDGVKIAKSLVFNLFRAISDGNLEEVRNFLESNPTLVNKRLPRPSKQYSRYSTIFNDPRARFLNPQNGFRKFFEAARGGETPFLFALMQEQQEIALYLLQKFPMVAKQKNYAGDTALHYAYNDGYGDIYSALIAMGVEQESDYMEVYPEQFGISESPDSQNTDFPQNAGFPRNNFNGNCDPDFLPTLSDYYEQTGNYSYQTADFLRRLYRNYTRKKQRVSTPVIKQPVAYEPVVYEPVQRLAPIVQPVPVIQRVSPVRLAPIVQPVPVIQRVSVMQKVTFMQPAPIVQNPAPSAPKPAKRPPFIARAFNWVRNGVRNGVKKVTNSIAHETINPIMNGIIDWENAFDKRYGFGKYAKKPAPAAPLAPFVQPMPFVQQVSIRQPMIFW